MTDLTIGLDGNNLIEKLVEVRDDILLFDSEFIETMPKTYQNSMRRHAMEWRYRNWGKVADKDRLKSLLDTWKAQPKEVQMAVARLGRASTGYVPSVLADEEFVEAMIEAFDSFVDYTNFHHYSMSDFCIKINQELRSRNSAYLFARPTFISWCNSFLAQEREWMDKYWYSLKFFDHLFDTYLQNKGMLSEKLDKVKSHAQKDSLLFFMQSKFKEYKPVVAGTNVAINNQIATSIKIQYPKPEDITIPIISNEQDIDLEL